MLLLFTGKARRIIKIRLAVAAVCIFIQSQHHVMLPAKHSIRYNREMHGTNNCRNSPSCRSQAKHCCQTICQQRFFPDALLFQQPASKMNSFHCNDRNHHNRSHRLNFKTDVTQEKHKKQQYTFFLCRLCLF